MIYLISEKKDLVTDLVIEWLLAKGRAFKRYNDNAFVATNTCLSNQEEQIEELKDVEKVWQRRGTLNYLPDPVIGNYPNRQNYINYLFQEVKILNEYQEQTLKKKLKKNYIGSYQHERTNNKLLNLAVAKEVGLQIPTTMVTSLKSELLAFYRQHSPIISKDLRAPVNIRTRHKDIIASGVKIVALEDIDRMEENFAPIFLQEYIEKQYEIRLFIVGDQFFPMAIFSQNDEQTKVDFRNYNKKKPNRCVPVTIPEPIEKRVREFMQRIDLNTGSVDLIRTPEGGYYFLEVNPMGQFHWVSQNCNYQIERAIAKILCDEKN